MIFLSVLNVLLYRYTYTGQTDIIVGSTVSVRDHEQLADQIGFYINTLALRTRFRPDDTFLTLLEKVKEVASGAYEHQVFPFDELVDRLEMDRDISRHPIFDVVIDMIDIGISRQKETESALTVRNYKARYNKTKFDLTVYVLEGEETLEILLEYNAGLFKAETVRRMARRFQALIHAVLANPGCQISQLPMDEAVEFPPLQPLAVDAESSPFTLPASYHQERLWFIDQFEAGKLYDSSPIYHNIPVILEIIGALDAEKLEQSISRVIKRHQALRTRLIAVDNKPFQCVDDVEKVGFQLRTLSSVGDPLSQALEEAKQPFFMDREPLIRGSLVRLDQQRFMLVLTVHHIVADKYSLEILVREIFTLYNVYPGNRVPRLPGPSFQYADFSQWQYRLPDDLVENLLFYWKRNLHAPLQALELPTDRPRAAVHIYEDAAQTFSLPEALGEKIRNFSQAEERSIFIVLLAAFKILLHRYANQDEIIVGTGVCNRERPGTGEIIGPIANLLVLRSLLDSQSTVYDVFSALGKTVDKALRYREVPFDKLVLELNPQKDMSRTALFDVLFQYEEDPFQIPALDNLEIKAIETNRGWGKYDLNMLIYPGEGKTFSGTLVYNARYYDETTISRLIEHYRVLLESILEDPHQQISQLCLLTAGEKQQLLTRWNDTGAHYPVGKTIHRLFADQVERTPDRAALVYQGLQLSYRELDRQANRLAYHLGHSYGVQSGELIGIMVERSEKMISGLLGILKAGGAYIPIDHGYPSGRIDYILKDSETRLLITGERFKDKIDSRFAGTVVDIDASHREDKEGAGWENSPEDTAYVIYTSGTTGQPKGCMISHKNVVRLLRNDRFPFDFDEGDVWIMAHSYCFDFSVWEMYGALLYGGRLIVPQRGEVRDISVFLSVIKGHGVSVLNQTPPAFYRLITEEKETGDKILNRHLRVVIFGGDKLEPVYLREWTAMYPPDDIRLVNMYGITETTVHVTYYSLTDRDINVVDYISPIGRPLPETTIYILNRQLNLQPIGVTGEFYVGGTGVARGYLNRPTLTADKFLSDSYKSYRSYRTYFSKKIYKTGDLGRWLADGNIEFQGRVDHQVKIRGFRIEVGEIESQLLGHDEIKEALVIGREAPGQRTDRQGDGKSLCAYIVPHRRLEVPALREYLANRLPEYMIPSYFVQLAKMPLTPNGKVDRKKLPEPEAGSVEEKYTAPGDEVEKILMEIWLEVLGVKEHGIGIDSNFFELGGHSLKAAVLTSKIHKELNVKIPLEEMFITPTIRGLARYVKEAVQERFVSIAAGEEKKYYPLSSAQKRLFVIHRKNPGNVNYNATQVMVLAGILDIENLKQVFYRLMERHESFRTSFALIDGQPFQEIHENVELEIEYFELTAENTENSEISIIHDFIRPFNLSLPPLVRVGLIRKGETKHILIVDMHHIISDYISLRILLWDFASLYKGEELPLLRLQYRDYTEWQNCLLQSGQLKHQEEYWLKVFAGDIPVLNLSTDYPRPPVQRFEGERIDFAVDKELYEKLAESMKDTKTTLYMFLLAVCNVLLWKLTQQEDIVIGTPVMGRSHNDLENIIGMFVGQLPMRNRPSGHKTFREFLEEIKINALNAYENQDYQFDELTRKLGLQGDVSRHPLFDVVFAIFNKEEEDYLTGPEDLSFSVYPFEDRTCKTDLRFAAVEMADEIHMTLTYSSALFKRSTCEKMAERFVDILNQVVENGDMKLADITLAHSFSMAAASTLMEEEGDFGF
jgi:amino acid adenylation domain-containing protein